MDLHIIQKDYFKTILNQSLIIKNKVTSEKVEKIKQLHLKKLDLFNEMSVETSKDMLKAYAKLIETIEYEIQLLWGFNKDKNYHEWFNVPQCQCPKTDNIERQGTAYQIYNKFCPIHGD